eukprot:COSAG04_NODE_15003_length_547_cov_0.805804_2_plen_55_part_01
MAPIDATSHRELRLSCARSEATPQVEVNSETILHNSKTILHNSKTILQLGAGVRG